MEKGGKQLNAAVFWVAPAGECSLTRRRQAAAANDVATAGRLGRVGRGKLHLRQESKCSCVLVGHNEHDAGARRIVGHRKAIAHINKEEEKRGPGHHSLPSCLGRPDPFCALSCATASKQMDILFIMRVIFCDSCANLSVWR